MSKYQNETQFGFVAHPTSEYMPLEGKLMWEVRAFYTEDNRVTFARCLVMNGPVHSILMTLFVHPEVRGQTIGGQLLEFACANVVTSNNPVYVEADSFEVCRNDATEPTQLTDEQLREFYQRHGFVPVPGHPFSLVRPARTPKS
jgi:GNAT superfamily N-acetyltransferase